jgi:hypothetical protein
MQLTRPVSGQFAKLQSGFVWILALTLASSLAIAAQQPQQLQAPNSDLQASKGDPKQQRHEQLVADTAKLLELANELKADVDKSTKDTLSIPVVQKADEVGKLAKKLREEMKP